MGFGGRGRSLRFAAFRCGAIRALIDKSKLKDTFETELYIESGEDTPALHLSGILQPWRKPGIFWVRSTESTE